MKVRFKSIGDAIQALEKANKEFGPYYWELKLNEWYGVGDNELHLHYLSEGRRLRSLINKIKTWLEDQEKRLTKRRSWGKNPAWAWNQTHLANHRRIRKARRDRQREKYLLSVGWYEEYLLHRDLNPFHVWECDECNHENNWWAEDRIAEYNDQNNYHPYSTLTERDLWLQFGTYDGPEIHEEEKCYECNGPCKLYEKDCFSLYDVNNDMRDQDYLPDPEDDQCMHCGGSCMPGDCVDLPSDGSHYQTDVVFF